MLVGAAGHPGEGVGDDDAHAPASLSHGGHPRLAGALLGSPRCQIPTRPAPSSPGAPATSASPPSTSCSEPGTASPCWTRPACTAKEELAAGLEAAGARLVRGDMRDADARAKALGGGTDVVHLAAIVGDPACARQPELAREVNLGATKALLQDAERVGVSASSSPRPAATTGGWATAISPTRTSSSGRFRSTRRRRSEPSARCWIGPDGRDLPPARHRLRGLPANALRPDGKRIHSRPRNPGKARHFRRAVLAALRSRPGRCLGNPRVLESPTTMVAGEVFNVGDTNENYRKLDLVEILRQRFPERRGGLRPQERGSSRLQGGLRADPTSSASPPPCRAGGDRGNPHGARRPALRRPV